VNENITQQVLANITDDGFWGTNETTAPDLSPSESDHLVDDVAHNLNPPDGGVRNLTDNVT
jgi:hypothetical protein